MTDNVMVNVNSLSAFISGLPKKAANGIDTNFALPGGLKFDFT
jgi:hypothetical protein